MSILQKQRKRVMFTRESSKLVLLLAPIIVLMKLFYHLHHSGAHGLVASMSRYGNATLRTLPYKPPDLQYAANNLSGDLMLQFSYV